MRQYFISLLLVVLSMRVAFGQDALPGVLVIRAESVPAILDKNSQGVLITSDNKFNEFCSRYFVTELSRMFEGPEKSFGGREGDELTHWYLLNMSKSARLGMAIVDLNTFQWVSKAERSMNMPLDATFPNDVDFANQWSLHQVSDHDIDVPEAWDYSQGNSAVILGIIDTGVEWSHPDLGGSAPFTNGNIWTNPIELNGQAGNDDDGNGKIDDIRGWDFAQGDNDPTDTQGHGSHVAGIASAKTNNGEGIAGIGWNCKVLPLRVSTDDQINMTFAAQAMFYATYMGVTAINCSWGNVNEGGLGVAADYAIAHGVIIVASAGNANTDDALATHYLSSRGDCITVANTDQNDQRNSDPVFGSNYGTWITVSAPGTDIRSTVPIALNSYATSTGTSMAAPHVTGLVGLVKSRYPSWNATAVKQHVVNTADNIDALNPGFAGLLGSGRINAYRALLTGTTVGGNITASTTWTVANSPYTVISDVNVYNNATLTIEPGVTVRFQSGTGLRISSSSMGRLIAIGTPDLPILMTSESGIPGNWKGIIIDDRSDDGGSISDLRHCTIEHGGQPNFYNAGSNLYLRSTATPTLTYCTIRSSSDNEIHCNSASPIITNSTILGASGYSVFYLEGTSEPVIDGCHITGNGNYAWINSVSSEADPVISGCTFDGTVQNAIRIGKYFQMWDNTLTGAANAIIEVYGGTMQSVQRTWAKQNTNLPYRVLSDLTLSYSTVLTVNPGVTVQFVSGAGLRVGTPNAYSCEGAGGLNAIGMATDSITFTSASGLLGDWKGIVFDDESDVCVGSDLAYCNIENSGQANAYNVGCNVMCVSTSAPSMDHCTIRQSSDNSVHLLNSSIQINNCTIQGSNGYSVLYLDGDSNPVIDGCEIMGSGNYAWINSVSNTCDPIISGCIFSGSVQNAIRVGRYFEMWDNTLTGAANATIEVYGGTIQSVQRTWVRQNTNLPYRVLNDLTLSYSTMLTIDPDVTVQFASGAGLRVGTPDAYSCEGAGALSAVGTESQPITFTSASGLSGDWKGIVFDDESDVCVTTDLEYCIIEKAGQANFYNVGCNIMSMNTVAPPLNHCIVRLSSDNELYLVNSSPTITNSAIEGSNGYSVLYMDGNSNPVIDGCQITGNGSYAWVNSVSDQCDPVISGCTFGGAVQNAVRVGRYFQMWDNALIGATNAVIEVYGGTLQSVQRTWARQNTNLPYRVLADLALSYSTVLTVEPGVTVQFASGAGLCVGTPNAYSCEGAAALNAVGTESERIVFTSASGSPGDWKGIIFDDESDVCSFVSDLRYCTIENAGQTNAYSTAALHCRITSMPQIQHCQIRNNAGATGVMLDNASITLLASEISSNSGIGLHCLNGSSPNLGASLSEANDLYSNGSYNLQITGTGNVSAVYEYWGNTNEADIRASVYDQEDNPALGRVTYNPWTNASHALQYPDPGEFVSLYIDPLSIDEYLVQGSQVVRPITITNVSTNPIYVTLTENTTWLSISPIDGLISPGGNLYFDAYINSAGLAIGDYLANVVVSADDPQQPDVNISILLHVIPVADGPDILNITDVPNDQGRQVRVQWARSLYDGGGSPSVLEYTIWRRVDMLLLQSPQGRSHGEHSTLDLEGDWDYIGEIPAIGLDTYNIVAPTLADSNQQGEYYSVFVVLAHTENPANYYESHPDSGYSIDNLAPSAPLLAGLSTGGGIVLGWSAASEEDFNYYNIYRSTTPVDPDTVTQVHVTTIDTTFTDSEVAPSTYLYFLRAVDFNDNLSEASNIVEVAAGNLQAPGALTINVDSSGSGSLRWQPVPGAASYEIYEMASSEDTGTLLGFTTGTIFAIPLSDSRRFYTVRATF